MTQKENQELLCISSKTAQKWRDDGKIKYYQIGKIIFYKLSDILELLEKHKIEAL